MTVRSHVARQQNWLMTVRLKPIKEQVIVITGASSGIGLVTARMAAKRGARVMLTARNHDALKQLADEIVANESNGGMAAFLAADVADEAALRRVADEAVSRFGRIDTWVNGAGVSVYGRLTDVSLEDQRRVFETNFWGVVIGSRIAIPHLRTGGALINIGSVLSDRAVPLQGVYCAAKHAVKGFTDSLRMELEHDDLPIAVTLIKPYSIDTPYPEHAKNYLPTEPTLPFPVYAPEVVAETILHCAEHPTRDVYAGGGAKIMAAMGGLAPRLTDRLMENLIDMQLTDRPEDDRTNNSLYGPTTGLKERGGRAAYVAESSLYTQVSLHPLLTGAALAATGLTLASWLFRRTSAAKYEPTGHHWYEADRVKH
ncbi:MAG TPA: SDR family oxidoreductase [Nitrospira sp.]|nr:SDR family oxidoreductase [Nitrospira sp.]